MNHEESKELSQILERIDLEEILDASPDELPELLGVVGSPTIELRNRQRLAPWALLEESSVVQRYQPLFIHVSDTQP